MRIYLAVYGQEIIGGFGDEEKKIESGLRSSVRPPIIDPLSSHSITSIVKCC